MTGTAETEAGEFHDIYRLGVMVIPTHRPCVRKDWNDLMFKGRRQKFNKVLEDLVEANKKGQPVLVGTASVESSEVFSRMLKRANIRHTVLNAKFHEEKRKSFPRREGGERSRLQQIWLAWYGYQVRRRGQRVGRFIGFGYGET